MWVPTIHHDEETFIESALGPLRILRLVRMLRGSPPMVYNFPCDEKCRECSLIAGG